MPEDSINPKVDSKKKGGPSGGPVTGPAQGGFGSAVKTVKRKGMKKSRPVS